MMDWPKADLGFVNRSPEPAYRDCIREIREDDRLVDRLVALNEEDMALYEEALRLRTRRLEQGQAIYHLAASRQS